MVDKRKQFEPETQQTHINDDPQTPSHPQSSMVPGRFRRQLGNQAMQSLVEGKGYAPRHSTRGSVIQKQAEANAPAATTDTAPTYIVPDTATELAPGQMRQSEFLEQLKSAVCQTADDAMAGTIWSATGCPYIERWFQYYSGQDSVHVERALHRFAPATGAATSAAGYISIVCDRVRQGMGAWMETGRLDAPGPEESPSLGSGLLAGLRRLFFKAEGEKPSEANPQTVQAELGGGQPLESGIRQRMESAFGAHFPEVRVHTDSQAGQVSHRMKARALTVGDDIAFAPGEYRPGTPVGDALIAHELAHVLQQSGGSGEAPIQPDRGRTSELEADADLSAVQVILRLFGRGSVGRGAAGLPQLKSGLRLSRCSADESPTPEGVHYDRALGSCESSPVFEGIEHTADESVDQDELLNHLEAVNAGGVYVFYGHGAQERIGGPFVGINPASGHTVRGADLERGLSADRDPPTMVVLAACGSAALLENINNGGTPVAVGFSDSLSNLLGASALTVFMRELNNGRTLGEAQAEANNLIQGSSPILGGLGNGVEIRYLDGFNSRMTLAEIRAQHRGE